MTDEELIEYRSRINAQMAAMRAVLFSLIDLHPNQQALSATMKEFGERLTAEWLNSADLSDQFLAEFQKQMEGFQSRVQSDSKDPNNS